MRHLLPFRIASIGALLVASWFFSHSALAGWYTPTSGTTASLYDIDYYSGYVVAVGSGGTIRFSVDAGHSWSTSTSGTTSALYAVDSDSGYVLAVGYGGVILRSTNYGATWTAVTSGTTASLYDVMMNPYGRAFAVGYGGVLLTSTDYGATWSAQTSGTTNTLQAVDIWGTTRAYAVGSSGTILYWNGTTWSAQTSGTTETLYGVAMSGTTEAWVVGSGGVVRKTTDGTTWSSVTTITGQTLYSIEMSSSTAGGIMAKTGLYETTNGTTWAAASTGSWSSVSWVLNVDYGTIRFAVGASGNIRRYDHYGPAVGAVTPTTALEGVPVTFSVDATDEAVVTRCDIEILSGDGSGVVLDGVDSEDDSWTASYTLSAGTYTTQATCYDPAYNFTMGASSTLTVSAPADTTEPTVGSLIVVEDAVGSPSVFTVSASDDVGIDFCTLVILEGDLGSAGFRMAIPAYATADMTGSDGAYTATYTFTAAGDYTAYAYCRDAAGNQANTADAIFTIDAAAAASDTDDTAPTIGTPSPTSFTLGTSRTVTATVSDDVGIESCDLFIDAENAGLMTVSGGTASKSYTFSTNDWADGDTATVTVECADEAGNFDSTSVVVTLSEAAVADEETTTEEETATDEETVTVEEDLTNEDGDAEAGMLIKLACSEGADVNDPCKAVYFYSEYDGKRHAFPNEKVYFTWYANFDEVAVVSDEFMASLTLGRNITYRPGTRMVKFITVNTVYAVTRGGVLRPIDSEETAIALYGATWNQQIDDISDAFYGNYSFGDEVTSGDDYDAETEEDAITTIDANLQWQ